MAASCNRQTRTGNQFLQHTDNWEDKAAEGWGWWSFRNPPHRFISLWRPPAQRDHSARRVRPSKATPPRLQTGANGALCAKVSGSSPGQAQHPCAYTSACAQCKPTPAAGIVSPSTRRYYTQYTAAGPPKSPTLLRGESTWGIPTP